MSLNFQTLMGFLRHLPINAFLRYRLKLLEPLALAVASARFRVGCVSTE
jgi:hypothetical protein